MPKDVFAVLKEALGDRSPLPIDELNALCGVIAEEEPLRVLTSDKLYSLRRQLRQPTKVIFSYPLGFEALLVLFGSLGERWLGVFGELAAEDGTNVAKCVSLLRETASHEQDRMRSLLFVAHYIKRRHSELFAREFASQLYKPWSSAGLLLMLSLFDAEDTALLSPLNHYLNELDSANATAHLRTGQPQPVAAVRSAIRRTIRKIEGKPEKKWWQFWR